MTIIVGESAYCVHILHDIIYVQCSNHLHIIIHNGHYKAVIQ